MLTEGTAKTHTEVRRREQRLFHETKAEQRERERERERERARERERERE